MEPLHVWLTLVALGTATGVAAFTIARTKITEPLRLWIGKRSKWLGGLVGCPYCLSHWLAVVAVLLYQPRPVEGVWLADFGVAWLVTVGFAALTFGLVGRSIKATV